jgi:hypothetical protein
MRKGLPDPTPASKATIVTKGWLRRCGSRAITRQEPWGGSGYHRFSYKRSFGQAVLPCCYDPVFFVSVGRDGD